MKYSIAFQKESQRVQASFLMLGCFLLGPFWLVAHAMWMPSLIYLLIVVFTGGAGAFILPFFASALVSRWYLSQGWESVAPVEVRKDPNDHSTIILAGIGIMSAACLAFMAFLAMM